MYARKVFVCISPCNASGSRGKKNGVGMALDVAMHTPLDIVL